MTARVLMKETGAGEGINKAIINYFLNLRSCIVKLFVIMIKILATFKINLSKTNL